MDIQLTIDLDLQQYAERLLQTQLRLKRAVHGRRTRRSTASPTAPTRGRRWTRTWPSAPGRLQGAGRVGDRDEPRDRADRGDGELPDVRQPLVRGRRRQRRSSSRSSRPSRRRRAPLDPDQSALDQPGHPGPVQHGLVVQAVHRLRRARHRVDSAPATTYNDLGTYKLRRRSTTTSAPGAMRCEFRNSTCPPVGEPCGTATVNVTTRWPCPATRSSTSSARTFCQHSGRCCRTTCRLFGFGADTGIDLPFEFDGRVPTNELKAELAERRRAQPRTRRRYLQPGDNVQMAIGQGLMAATPLQLAVGYAHDRQRRLRAHAARSCRRSGPRRRPTASPGYADLTQADDRRSPIAPRRAARSRCRPRSADPIVDGLRAQRHRARAPTAARRPAEELFDDYPADAIQIAGKTGTAQGAGSYPWNDSSVFAAFSIDPSSPYTVVSYLEKAGYGSHGAAPVVKCMFLALSGMIPLDPVAHLRAARHQRTAGRRPRRCRRRRRRAAWRSIDDRRHDRARTDGRDGPVDPAAQARHRSRQHPLEPGDPSRNIDWVLLLAQAVLTVDGLLRRLLGVARPHAPTRTRSSPARSSSPSSPRVVMFVVMAVDYEWLKERARTFCTCLTIVVLSLLSVVGLASGRRPICVRPRADPTSSRPRWPSSRCCWRCAAYLADERSDEVSYARFLGGLMLVGVPAVLVIAPARPRLGVGADRHRDGRAARRRGQGPVHRR